MKQNRYYNAIHAGLFILLFSGCASDSYIDKYQYAEDAYLGDDSEVALQVLHCFEEFLVGKLPKKAADGVYRNYIMSIFLTNIRLFDIYRFLGYCEEAEHHINRAIDFALLLNDGDSKVITKSDIIDLISEIESNDAFVPGWKKK